MNEETAKAYAAFLAYCELGINRSLRKLVDKTGTKLAQLGVWSSKYNWQERVKEYDAEQAAERNEARRKRREEMEDRHAREAKEEQEIARKHIKSSIVPQNDGTEKYKSVSLSAVQLLKNSREDERKALGIEDNQELAVEVNANGDNVQVIVYYPQSQEKEA